MTNKIKKALNFECPKPKAKKLVLILMAILIIACAVVAVIHTTIFFQDIAHASNVREAKGMVVSGSIGTCYGYGAHQCYNIASLYLNWTVDGVSKHGTLLGYFIDDNKFSNKTEAEKGLDSLIGNTMVVYYSSEDGKSNVDLWDKRYNETTNIGPMIVWWIVVGVLMAVTYPVLVVVRRIFGAKSYKVVFVAAEHESML